MAGFKTISGMSYKYSMFFRQFFEYWSQNYASW